MEYKERFYHLFTQPYNRNQFQQTFAKVFGNKRFSFNPNPKKLQLSNTEHKLAQSVSQIGSMILEDNDALPVYEVIINPQVIIERNKVGVNELIKKHMLREVKNGAIAVFSYPEDSVHSEWRFSFISKEEGSEYFQEIEKKETPSKRYTYIFGTPETHKTAIDRFVFLTENLITLDNLFYAFSVEKLSNVFFKEYTVHYQNFVQFITGKRIVKKNGKWVEEKLSKPNAMLTWAFDGNEKAARDFVKKMLGRIIFLYFIQKKGWLGASDNDYKDGDPNFIQNLFDLTGANELFYQEGLSGLFFEALNTARPHDDYKLPDGSHVKIPFLNGGLFEMDEIDKVIDSKANAVLFPGSYFSNPEDKETPNERGFLNFLNAFNFTIDEDSEEEKTVAVDPEMLGHIFENLLEDNKNKGAYYTPIEIVRYMTQESLIEYLLNHLSKDYTVYKRFGKDQVELFGKDSGQLEMTEKLSENALNRKEVEYIVKRKDVSNLTDDQLQKINRLLDTVKICDPAIGSGAFPMGLLKEIFAIKERIAYHLDKEWNPDEVKEGIIQNSVYGVDIEKGAVDIARLRFWLSLVVDETYPHALPNLDFKIMQGDSLLESFEGIPLDKLMTKRKLSFVNSTGQQDMFGASKVSESHVLNKNQIEALEKLVHEYFTVVDLTKKNEIREKIDDIVNEHIEYNLELEENRLKIEYETTLKSLNSIKAENASTEADKKKWTRKKKKLQKELDDIIEEQDRFAQARKALEKAKNKSIKPYFLWHLYFKNIFDEDGFDIVIGNPPYIQLQKLNRYADLLQEENYETYLRTSDIYTLFYEKGVNLLKNQGILTYISSNKWMRAEYGQSIRKFFKANTNPIRVIDFGNLQNFENATVDTNILMLKRETNQNATITTRFTKDFNPKKQSLEEFISKNYTLVNSFADDEWVVLDKKSSQIKSKVEKQGIPLRDWNIEINYGIKTGLNEAFVIDEVTKDYLISQEPKSKWLLKPILRGKDVKRWKANFADKWLINSHNGYKAKNGNKVQPIDINNFPIIKDYLNKYWDNLKPRADQGFTPYNLRNCAYIENFEKPKIIYSDISKYLYFMYDENNYYTTDRCYMITGKHLKYLVAFLNSKLFKFCFDDSFPHLQGQSKKLAKVYFEKIPVKEIDRKTEKEFDVLVDKITAIRRKNPSENVSQLENEIDQKLYKLYGLSKEEIEFVEENMAHW